MSLLPGSVGCPQSTRPTAIDSRSETSTCWRFKTLDWQAPARPVSPAPWRPTLCSGLHDCHGEKIESKRQKQCDEVCQSRSVVGRFGRRWIFWL